MTRFDIITEADARTIEAGTTVVLARGGLVTPLARDTLRARRITVAEEDQVTAEEGDLVPVSPVRTLAIGSDHAGLALKRDLVARLRGAGFAVHDLGTHEATPVDYPDVAARVARAITAREADAGIVIDGGGIGSAVAANKIDGIRAAMCTDETVARYAREHNGTNVLCLGASLLTPAQAGAVAAAWLGATLREPRYIRRLAKIRALERNRR
jgi:ribose 5-phosphate isomerase B